MRPTLSTKAAEEATGLTDVELDVKIAKAAFLLEADIYATPTPARAFLDRP